LISRRHLCCGSLAALACAATPLSTALAVEGARSWPRTFVDALSRRVVIQSRPARILPLFSSNTEIVAGLGGAERIVGIDGMTKAPPEILDRPRVGNRLGFSADIIARLAPDLVILTPSRHAAASLLRPMEIARIPVVVLTHPTVKVVMRNILEIGQMIGAEQQAQQVITKMHNEFNDVSRHLAGRKLRTVYFETGSTNRGQSMSVRPGSYTDDMLRLAGGQSVFPTLSSLTQVSGEAVRLANPDVIVVAGDADKVEALKQRPGWSSIPAVAAGRVVPVPRGLFLIPGPRLSKGVRLLARHLHSSAFNGKEV